MRTLVRPVNGPNGGVGNSGGTWLVGSWPRPLGEAAYYGLAGEFVRLVEPHTEADPASLLVQLLAATGNVDLPRDPALSPDGSETVT